MNMQSAWEGCNKTEVAALEAEEAAPKIEEAAN